MKRHFYLASSLSELDGVVKKLYAQGVTPPQVHVLTENDAGLAEHPLLQDVEAVLRTDVVHGTERGAMLGAIVAAFILFVAYAAGWAEGVTWVPFIFLSIVALGFCTWEGGLLGIQMRNRRFKKFSKDLKAGKHVLLVDVSPAQSLMVEKIVAESRLEVGGKGDGAPDWVVEARNKYNQFVEVMP